MKFLFKSVSIALLLVFITGCANKAPITNRNQFIFMSEQEEIALGERSYKKTLKDSKLSSNKTQTKRGQRNRRKNSFCC